MGRFNWNSASPAKKMDPIEPITVGDELGKLTWHDVSPADLPLINEINREFEVVKARLGLKFKPITIRMNYNMRSVAGVAKLLENEIELNIRLLRMNRRELIPTFVHEMCHLLVYEYFGRQADAHGWEWKQMMRSAGYSPERTHSMDTSALSRTRAKYKCDCACGTGAIEVGGKVRNKIAAGATYRCRSCKSIIKLSKGKYD